MDFNNPAQRAVFFDVHHDLPREAPGNRACVSKALELVGTATGPISILDIGCGPGKQTLQLAEMLPEARITAIDAHPAYVDALNTTAAKTGLAGRVEARVGDMTALDFPAASFDLIWCEGAAYIMGFRAALAAWKPLLKPAGRLALTEAVWLKGDPPERVRQFWRDYPQMTDIPSRREHVATAGYKLLGDFALPEEAWWDDYYTPMAHRISVLRERYADDEVAERVLTECEDEIDLYRLYSDFYGYAFFVMT